MDVHQASNEDKMIVGAVSAAVMGQRRSYGNIPGIPLSWS